MKPELFFEKLEKQLQVEKPFVAYSKPGLKERTTKARLQATKETFTTKDFKESGFVFSPFNAAEKTYLIPSIISEEITTEYFAEEDSKENISEAINFPPALTNAETQKQHEELIQRGIESVEKGRFEKVVLSRSEKVATQLKAIEIFKNLLKKYSSAFVYIWYHPETGIWLGASPERLLEVERNKFKTMALAGTQSYKGHLDVNWREKEIDEQQIVTDAIFENLKDKVSGNIKKSELYTSRAGNLLHLKTDIQGFLDKNTKLEQLIMALHPTPAVCGLPKEKAKNFILERENYNREFYSGFLGELNIKFEKKRNSNRRNQENQAYASISKKTDLFVNLRCMKLEAGKAILFVGGGITKDSNPTEEWEETVNKTHTIKSVLVK